MRIVFYCIPLRSLRLCGGLCGALLLLLAMSVAPAVHAKPAPTQPAPVRHEDAPTAPVLSDDVGWTSGLLVGVAVLFAAAILIGPIYRLTLPGELPVTHAHDEPPGASHHHGPSGTVDYSAPDRNSRQ